jgi:hypothetical protein
MNQRVAVRDLGDRAIESADTSVYLTRMRALARANEIRLARSRLKRRIADGEVSAVDVLLAPAPEVEGLALVDLLRSQPRWGEVRIRRFTLRNAVDERKPIGQLTLRQRTLLAAALGDGFRASGPRAGHRPAA